MNARKVSCILVVAAVVCGLLASPSWADGPKGTAVIKGKVTIDGQPPAARPIQMSADKFCEAHHTKPVTPQGKMVFPDGSLPYAFVYIKSGIEGRYAAPSEPLEIDQQGCMYKPHVAGMVAGQALRIVNSDDTNHNIHSLPTKNTAFNFSQPKKGMTKDLTGPATFNKPEVMVKVKCDVHPWMGAYIGVLPHPFFAVTGVGGAFEIKDLPAGKYTLAVWHEEWGTLETAIEVKDGATAEQTFTFSKKTSSAEPPAREVIVAAEKR